MAMAQQPDEERSEVFLVFIGASAVIVTLIVICLIALFFVSRISTRPQPSGADPYGLAARVLPTVTGIGEVLPETLGTFKRTALSGSFDTFSATYTSDKDKITLAGSRAVSVRAAQASVALAARAAGGRVAGEQFDADPSYSLSSDDKGQVRLIWSHNRWFFDVQATSRAVLDEFMKAFKY
jgi:hypothetical protein